MPLGVDEHACEQEKINRANRFIRVFDKYTPHFGITQITEKFYARHDAVSHDIASNPTLQRYYDQIGKRFITGPRELHDAPILDSHNYGWLWDKASKYIDENDRELFWKGRRQDPLIKLQKEVNLGMRLDRFYKMSR